MCAFKRLNDDYHLNSMYKNLQVAAFNLHAVAFLLLAVVVKHNLAYNDIIR